MFKIQTLNNISRNGLDRLPATLYRVANDIAEPDAVLVRSADMRKSPIAPSVKAVARAGAGVNNIPVGDLSARGVPMHVAVRVLTTPHRRDMSSAGALPQQAE